MADGDRPQHHVPDPITVERWPIDDVRARRAELQSVETGLSYLRRVVQGRVDIVAAELARRRDGGDPADLGSLIDDLPAILAEHLRAPGVGRLPSGVEEGDVDPELAARVDDASVATDRLAALDDDELAALGERLAGIEREVSERRRELFAAIDVLQAELTRRYRTGEADVESLLR